MTEDPSQDVDVPNEAQQVWRFFGISRSGNHAIIDWFLRNLGHSETVFLNNCLPGDPFRRFSYCRFFRKGTFEKHRGDIHRKENRHFVRLMETQATARWLVVSYENQPIEAEARDALWSSTALSAPLAGDICILRSPLNLVASSLQRIRNEVNRPRRRKQEVAAWEERILDLYAAHVAAAISGAPSTVIYDRWGTDESYRKAILEEHAIPVRDTGLGEMTTAGGGSSFGRTQNIE
ncbi:MAG: hypothetical protein AAFW69_01075, partial [Pseudomonadota bacterium]